MNASAIAEHVWNEHHRMDWSVVEVVDTEQYLCPRLLLELWHIHSEQNPMNRERGSLQTVSIAHSSRNPDDFCTIFIPHPFSFLACERMRYCIISSPY